MRREMTRDMFQRDVNEFGRMSDAQLVEVARIYRKTTDPHRANALEIANLARTAKLPADSPARIRAALEADLKFWHEAFPMTSKEWNAARSQWLVDVNSLSGEQWAAQRANWFAARDVWIEARLQKAQARRR